MRSCRGPCSLLLCLCLSAATMGCSPDDVDASSSSGTTTTAGSGGATTSSAASGGGGSSSTATSTGAGGGSGDIPGGGAILLEERFDDASFAARGWYDGAAGAISTTETAPGSTSSFECQFQVGATSCTAGKPARHVFPSTESVYLSFFIKLAPNWVGSGLPYHPHMFNLVNDRDDDYVGPASSYLTTYVEVVDGDAVLALQDNKNIDNGCILRDDDTFVGCGGDFDSYAFTENRSVCACNGLLGDLDTRGCFPNGGGTFYSTRGWHSAGAITDAEWHFVEAYFEMNTIEAGVGIADGKIRWVQDGVVLISSDEILMRTNANATLGFRQLAFLPYIGDGSPIAQSFWIDDLTVATARP